MKKKNGAPKGTFAKKKIKKLQTVTCSWETYFGLTRNFRVRM